MKGFIRAVLFLNVVTCVTGCLMEKPRAENAHFFRNGYGDVIIISTQGAMINGEFYTAEDCSGQGMNCIKYGSLFAIMAPASCPIEAGVEYVGHAAGIHSFIISFTPHDRSNVQLGTDYGDGLSFGYHGNVGVTNLYYDPAVRLGDKKVWLGLDYFDLKKVRYEKIGKEKFLPCKT